MIIERETIPMGWNLDNSYARLPKTFFKLQNPTPVREPKLVVLNDSLAISLGLNPRGLKKDEGIAVLAGNQMPEGSLPLAQAYGGHQFGHFVRLGDGRAILIGEQITPDGKRFDIQLKGCGRTPYSRGGDGRAALGPMLREYIISEAMHALGIPTTRSLAVVTTGEEIFRETPLPGAILTRVAASHIRVGTFQYVARWGTTEDLKTLADYTIKRHYPDLEEEENPYLALLQRVIEGQAMLIAKWQLVGFIHGVMNTDNITISGETIDYGPCAFMDTYDPATVFSSIDIHGRYAYGNQPNIGSWNMARFAETLLPLLHQEEAKAIERAQEAIEDFANLYNFHWLAGMRAKLGLANEEIEDTLLISNLLSIMEKYKADYTNTFKALTFYGLEDGNKEKMATGQEPMPLKYSILGNISLLGSQEFNHWYVKWKERLTRQPYFKETFHELMKNTNPGVIPRNHRVEEALDAAVKEKDYSVMEDLLKVLSKPYTHHPDQDKYVMPPEPWNRPYRTFCGT